MSKDEAKITITKAMISRIYELGQTVPKENFDNLTMDEMHATIFLHGLKELLEYYSIVPNFKIDDKVITNEEKKKKHKFLTD